MVEEKEVINRITSQRRGEEACATAKFATWSLERKSCVSSEKWREEEAECRSRLCCQVGRTGSCGGLSLMVCVPCRRWLSSAVSEHTVGGRGH